MERGEGEEGNSEGMNHLETICFLNLVVLALYEQRGPGRWLLKPFPLPATAHSRLQWTAPQHHCWESLTFNDLMKRSSYLLDIQWSNPCLFQPCYSGSLSLPLISRPSACPVSRIVSIFPSVLVIVLFFFLKFEPASFCITQCMLCRA